MRDRAVVVPGFLNLLMVAASGLIYHRLCVALVRRFHLKLADRERRSSAVAAAISPPRTVAAERIVNRH